MKIKRTVAVIISGVLWLLIGLMLLTKGLNFLVAGGREESALVLIAVGLLLGFVKGKFVLSKTVKRTVARIDALPAPIPLSKLYAPSYYLLILGMVLLGISLRWLPVPLEVRGTIDVAIGAALINGAQLYFRSVKKKV